MSGLAYQLTDLACQAGGAWYSEALNSLDWTTIRRGPLLGEFFY